MTHLNESSRISGVISVAVLCSLSSKSCTQPSRMRHPMINTDIRVWKSESTAKQSGTDSLDRTTQGQTKVMTTRFSKSLEKEAMPCRLETSGKSWRAEEEFDLAMSVWVGIRYLEKGSGASVLFQVVDPIWSCFSLCILSFMHRLVF